MTDILKSKKLYLINCSNKFIWLIFSFISAFAHTETVTAPKRFSIAPMFFYLLHEITSRITRPTMYDRLAAKHPVHAPRRSKRPPQLAGVHDTLVHCVTARETFDAMHSINNNITRDNNINEVIFIRVRTAIKLQFTSYYLLHGRHISTWLMQQINYRSLKKAFISLKKSGL